MNDPDFVKLVDDFGSFLLNGMGSHFHRLVNLVAWAEHERVERVPTSKVAVVAGIASARLHDLMEHALGLAERIEHDMPENADAIAAAAKLRETVRSVSMDSRIDLEVLREAKRAQAARASEISEEYWARVFGPN